MFLPTSPRPPSGMIRMLTGASWHQPVPVTREERRLADVRRADRLCDEPLEPEGEAAVRRHAVTEGIEIRGEGLRVHATRSERRDVVLVAMQALAARHDLEAAVQQVEAARPLRPFRVLVCVERPLPRREAFDEDELAVLGADAALV